MKVKDKKQLRALKHGANSPNFKQRFDDLRTTQGQALHNTMQNLISDLGGEMNLTAPMRIMLNSNIRPKIVTLMCINTFLNKQRGDIINESGELVACLGNNYLAFSNALRLDLQALNDMAQRAGKTNNNIPTIDELIQANKT